MVPSLINARKYGNLVSAFLSCWKPDMHEGDNGDDNYWRLVTQNGTLKQVTTACGVRLADQPWPC
jgi:hypothetical protein